MSIVEGVFMQKNYTLTEANIDKVSEEVVLYLKEKKQKKEDIIRARLNLETVLLFWLENGFANETFTIDCRKRFVRCEIRLILQGRYCDPLQKSDDEIAEYMATLHGNLGLATTFKYVHGRNVYDIKMPLLAMNHITKICIAIFASVVTWQLLSLLPKEVVTAINTNVIDPTFAMILGLIKAVASLLIFFNVSTAICSMGDLTTLSKLGGRLMERAQIHNIFWLIFGTLVAIFVFGTVDFSGGITFAMLGDIYKMVLGVIPSNLFEPFVSGNTLQVLFLAVCTGILLLMLDRETGDLIKIFRQCDALLITGIGYFCVFVPVIIYLSFTSILLGGDFGSSILNCWKIIVAAYVVGLITIFGETSWCALENKFNIKNHFMRIMPISLMAYTTASTAACVPLMGKTLREEGVDENYNNFALPFSQTFCVSGTVVSIPISILGLLAVYGQSMSVSGLILNMVSTCANVPLSEVIIYKDVNGKIKKVELKQIK